MILSLVISSLALLIALLSAVGTVGLRYRAWGWELRWRAQVAEMRGDREQAKDFDTVAQHNFELARRWRLASRLGLGR